LYDRIKLEFKDDIHINNEKAFGSPIFKVKWVLKQLKDIPTMSSYKRIQMEREEGKKYEWECPLEESIEIINSLWCQVADDLTSIKRSIDACVKKREHLRAARESSAATTIVCWWRRRQLDDHFKKMKEESTAATTIFCWWRRKQLGSYFETHRAARIIQLWNRRCMIRIRCKASHAATLIQRWRISIVNRRKEDKLEDAALSSPFRNRGQPLQQLSRRTRHRHSKRYRSKRKRGQKRGRPPNSSSQQLSRQQSIERRENVSGYALSNSGRSSNRGSVFGSVHNNSSGHITAGPYVLGKDLRNKKLNRRGTELGEALQFESSSRGNAISNSIQAGSESSHSPTQPISSPTKKSRRRRRRHRVRRNRRKSILSTKDEASPSHRHTPIASHPSFDANLSTMSMSNFCDGISHQYQQASSKDRNLLIKFMCHMVIQTIDNQTIEPSTIDNTESSISTPTTVSSNPSSNESTEDESEDAVSLELQSHVAEVETNLNQHLADFNESFSSINTVDSNTPKSTLTSLNAELPSSASINTEEISTRHEKPMSYLNALIGTTTNFG
jgi:hypothetical protein